MAKTKAGTATKPVVANKGNFKYPKELLMHWYREMMLQRRLEEKAYEMYMQQKIKGFLHLYIGQEAISSGIESAITRNDYVITAYRCHGNALVRGVTPREIMAELYGKFTGCVKGNGGSMHMFTKEGNFLGGHGIVGAQIPVGTGVAFAEKYRGTQNLCVTMFGDGAVRQGALHEAFNLAMLWKLPVLYICENNQYAMGTSVERTSNVTDIHTIGEAYDMTSWAVNAMDVFEVYENVRKATDLIRSGHGPVFLEMKTYRFKGHSMSDPGKYRTKDELNEYKDRDPVLQVKSYIIENKVASIEDLDVIDASIEEIVKDAVEFAEASPYPEPSELYNFVYTGDYPYIKE